jgi:hypothetical protein
MPRRSNVRLVVGKPTGDRSSLFPLPGYPLGGGGGVERGASGYTPFSTHQLSRERISNAARSAT